jgi:hypothetical protein
MQKHNSKEVERHDEKRRSSSNHTIITTGQHWGHPKSTIPAGVQEVLHKYSELFQEPKSLPPQRNCDHSIPLQQGTQPVNIKPYRYSLTQKDEIEKQLKEMLQQGIINSNTSSFASLVLLVKKKDGT